MIIRMERLRREERGFGPEGLLLGDSNDVTES
jgi:hypothetical protein